jgi:hypothetical protein
MRQMKKNIDQTRLASVRREQSVKERREFRANSL